MEPIQVRKLISDRRWKTLAAGAPGDQSDREFVEAVLYLNRTGCPWRDLPGALGRWHAVYMRFRRWEERGVWRRLWEQMHALTHNFIFTS